ncbi:hypothetical protein EMCRGX_G030426 [Ephydatia muelleri]
MKVFTQVAAHLASVEWLVLADVDGPLPLVMASTESVLAGSYPQSLEEKLNGGRDLIVIDYGSVIEFTFFAVNGAGNGNVATATYIGMTKTGFQTMVVTRTLTVATITASPVDSVEYNKTNSIYEMHIEYKELEVSTKPTEQLWSSSVEIDNFNEPVGPTFLIEQAPCTVYIQPDIPDSAVEHIASQTNPYAKEALSPVQYSTSAWQDTTADEIGAFFGMNILIGLVQMPSIEDYWKTDKHFHYQPIAARISKKRFKDLSRFLHFTPKPEKKKGEAGFDRLGKIRPVINMLKESTCNSTVHK